MKRLICLFLGLAVVFSLAAGCSDVSIGQTEPTTRVVGEEELNIAMGQLGADLDAAANDALRNYMAQGVTLPVGTEPIVTMPPPMPTGVQIRAEDVYPLMERVRNILNSKTYTLKARGAAPPTAGMPLGTTPVTFVSDKDKSAFEVQMDWTNMLKAITQGTPEYNMAAIQGAAMTTFFGKKVRFISKPDGDMILLLDKKQYAPIPRGEDGEGGGGDSPLSMASMFGDVFSPPKSTGNVQASKVTDGGKDYLCATIPGEEGLIMRYYFAALDSNLRRIEMEAKNPDTGAKEVMVFEIEELSDKVDPAVFSTAGFKALSLDELAQLGEGSFGLLG